MVSEQGISPRFRILATSKWSLRKLLFLLQSHKSRHVDELKNVSSLSVAAGDWLEPRIAGLEERTSKVEADVGNLSEQLDNLMQENHNTHRTMPLPFD